MAPTIDMQKCSNQLGVLSENISKQGGLTRNYFFRFFFLYFFMGKKIRSLHSGVGWGVWEVHPRSKF
jgi:hypothetical protein